MSARMLGLGMAVVALASGAGCTRSRADAADLSSPTRLALQGRQTFRHDTFGDEAFWGGTLRLHEAIAGAANGGVGPGVSPKTALAVGLKVDVDALPQTLQQAIAAGQVNLADPATTLALLSLDSVVGVKGFFDPNGKLAHAKGGFYHDGRFATLGDVVDHYDATFGLGLTAAEKADLVEYLESL